jgi:hypothetical protein
MAGEEIVQIGSGDLESAVRSELDHHLGGERQRRYRRFSCRPLAASLESEVSSRRPPQSDPRESRAASTNSSGSGLRSTAGNLSELAITLAQIIERLESLGDEIPQRIESEQYLALVGRAFRAWDEADTQESGG